MNPVASLDGWKSYLAAAGLFGLALYQASTGDYLTAWQSLMAALAVLGIKRAIVKEGVKQEAILRQSLGVMAARADRP